MTDYSAKVLVQQIDPLADAILQRQYEIQPELNQRYDSAMRAICLQDIKHHLRFLSQALVYSSPILFADYIHWLRVVLETRGVPTRDLMVNLQCIEEVVKSEVNAELAQALRPYLEMAQSEPPAFQTNISMLVPQAQHAELASAYLDALLISDRRKAVQLILDAVNQRQIPIREIYLHVFQPAQYEIGHLWQTNKINVAHEHYATAVTQLAMSQLYPQIFAMERAGFSMVATCIGDELHEIGIRMVADFFEMAGWDTYYLGANTPANHICSVIEERQADVVAISATLTPHLEKVQSLIETIRASSNREVKILVGGYPFNLDPQLWQRIGADGFASDADGAIATARSILHAQETMKQPREQKGLTLLCKTNGVIIEVIHDDLGITGGKKPILSLSDLFGAYDSAKLLDTIQNQKALYNWQLNIPQPTGISPLHFTGSKIGDQILIAGCTSQNHVAIRFYEELMRINNEQVNALRRLQKEKVQLAQKSTTQNAYEELTQLNNELVTLQRTLAKQNAEIASQRERYRIVSEMSSDFAYALRFNASGQPRLEWATSAFGKITGYEPHEITFNKSIFNWVHPEDLERVQRLYDGLEHLQDVKMEYRILTKSGQSRWVLNYVQPVWTADHTRLQMIYGAMQDITARKDAEEKMHAAQKRMQRWIKSLEQSNQEALLLADMNFALQSCSEIAKAPEIVTRFTEKLFPNRAGMLFILNLETDQIDFKQVWNRGENLPITLSDDCLMSAKKWRQQSNSPDLPLNFHLSTSAQPKIEDRLCFPVLLHQHSLWVIQLEENNSGTEISNWLMRLYTEHTRLSLSNLSLRETLRTQAIHDPLTGLFNRRHFYEFLDKDLKRSARKKTHLSVILFDIDHFKRFNDQFGHSAGDEVLKEVAAQLKKLTRSGDVVCRYGGEEFIIAMSETIAAIALERAETIRESIAHLQIEYEGVTLPACTISAGIAYFPRHGHSRDELLTAADAALYAAKNLGRNRVILAE